jgi:hypothetical protein
VAPSQDRCQSWRAGPHNLSPTRLPRCWGSALSLKCSLARRDSRSSRRLVALHHTFSEEPTRGGVDPTYHPGLLPMSLNSSVARLAGLSRVRPPRTALSRRRCGSSLRHSTWSPSWRSGRGSRRAREGSSKGARKEAAAASRTATIQVARTTAGRHRQRGALAPLRLDEGSPPKGAGSRRCRVPQGPAEEPKAGVVGCFH